MDWRRLGKARAPLEEASLLKFDSTTARHVHFPQGLKVSNVERARPQRQQSSVSMSTQFYQTFTGDSITDSMLSEAAKLFTENYGTWGKLSERSG